MKSSEFFESIPQTEVKVGPYNTYYPVFYRDTAYMSVFLLAPLDKVKSLLTSKRMHPFRLTPWHGMVTMSASQHKRLLKELNLGKVLQYQYCPSGQAILTTVTESYRVE